MYQLPSKPAVVRNIRFHSYKPFLGAIILLLALNLLKDFNLLAAPANASQEPSQVVQPPKPAEWIPMETDYNSYRLVIQSEYQFVLMDGERVVHVFQRSYKPNANLFHVVDVDNE